MAELPELIGIFTAICYILYEFRIRIDMFFNKILQIISQIHFLLILNNLMKLSFQILNYLLKYLQHPKFKKYTTNN